MKKASSSWFSNQKPHCYFTILFIYMTYFFGFPHKMSNDYCKIYLSPYSTISFSHRRYNNSGIVGLVVEGGNLNSGSVPRKQLYGRKTMIRSQKPWASNFNLENLSNHNVSLILLIFHCLICTIIIMRTRWNTQII